MGGGTKRPRGGDLATPLIPEVKKNRWLLEKEEKEEVAKGP